MTWIAFLLVAFLVIGLRRGAAGGGRHTVIVLGSALTMLAVYMTLGKA